MFLCFTEAAVLALSFLFVQCQSQWIPGQNVQSSSGAVTGRAAALKGHESVSEYLNIPFVLPPTGTRRWSPPQRFTDTTRKINGTAWGPSCPSGGGAAGSIGVPAGLFGSNMDEDCLSIAVWTKPQTGEKKKAVLISIYGGGFNIGSANSPHMHGSALADREDVVVVAMNYRLNAFGFPGAPGLSDENLGMLDIRAAVEWTRDNIEAFGGDPKRMVIFGESAGGGAVDYYAFAWPDDPIVHGFIPMSGSVYTRGIAAESTGNLPAWYKASKALGCGGEEAGAKTTECMRGKGWREVLKVIDTGMRSPGKTFGPTFDEKIIFSEKEYFARAEAGKFAKVVSPPIFRMS
jgi:cholinesterase